jgi:hypothetical protein
MGKSGISFPEMEKSTLTPKISTAILHRRISIATARQVRESFRVALRPGGRLHRPLPFQPPPRALKMETSSWTTAALPTGTCIFSGVPTQMPLEINVRQLPARPSLELVLMGRGGVPKVWS